MIDRDNDGIPDSQQITTEELDDIDHGMGRSVIEIATADKSRLARDVGRTKDKDFNPADLEYVSIPKPIVFRDNKTGELVTLNWNRFIEFGIIELRKEYSWRSGIMGPRDAAISSNLLGRLGTAGAFLGALLSAGGSAPALLARAAVGLLARSVKNPTAKSLLEQLAARRLLIAILLVLSLVGPAFAATPPNKLVLYDDMLTALARTKEPELRISYTADHVELRTRRSALIGWIDVLLTARFQHCNGHVRLVAQSLRVGPIEQRGSRLEDARAGLMKLVDVDMPSDRVEVYRAGQLVYSQALDPAPAGEGK